jgi:hypothetical protein
MRLGIAIYEHSAYTLSAGSAYMAKPLGVATMYRPRISSLRISGGIQNDVGGDQACSFTVAVDPLRGLFCGKGDLVFVYGTDVDRPLWAGRISETPRIYGTQPKSEIHAAGCWVTMNERLLTYNFDAVWWTAGAPNISEVVAYCLRDWSPTGMVAADLTDVPYYSSSLGTGALGYPQYSRYLADMVRDVVAFGDDATPPKPTYFTVGSWRENYLGKWIDSQFGVTIWPPGIEYDLGGAGTCEWNPAASGDCVLTTSGAAADAAHICDWTMMQPTTYQRDAMARYQVKVKWNPTSGNGILFGIFSKATKPVTAAAAALLAEYMLLCWQDAAGNITIAYYDDADADWFWDEAGGAWSALGAVAIAGTVNTDYIVIYEHNATGMKLGVYDATGVTCLAETDVLPWATWTTKNKNQLWWLTGDPWEDTGRGVMTVEYVQAWRWAAGSQVKLTAVDVTDWEWEIHTSEIDSYTLTNPDESMANYIVSAYGTPTGYTAVAQDLTSQAKYGRRDYLIDASGYAASAAALRLRDKKLEAAKDEVWRGSSITLKGKVRRKDGSRVPCWNIRAGERMRVCNVNWPTGLVFVVGSTEYDDEAETISVTPADLPDAVSTWLVQLAVKTAEID